MTRVIVVDDIDQNRDLLRSLLAGNGYDVVEARHGRDALALARTQQPRLIISDLLMPVMDGYALLRHWKADEALRDIPFVVYTATYTEPKDMQLAMDLGADAFIVKPTEPDHFIERIREVLAVEQRSGLTPAGQPVDDDTMLLREYNAALVRKLEDRAVQLQAANRELAASEARLRAIFDAEPECVKVLDADGTLLDMNPAGLRIIEAEHLGEVQHRCIYPLVAERHRTAFRHLNECAARGQSGVLEYEIRGLKGGHRWLETHATPLRDASGAVAATLSITRDITARREAEATLRQLVAAVEAASDIIEILDHRGAIIYANPAYEQRMGCRLEDVRGQRPEDLVDFASDTEAYTAMLAAARAGRQWKGTLKSRYRGDRQVEEDVTVSPIRGEDGRVSAYVVMKRDVTEQRDMALQLQRAQRLESIGQLASGIAHEINTPAQYVSDNIRFLQDACTSLTALLDLVAAPDHGDTAAWCLAVREAAAAMDIDFLREEIPHALAQSGEGLSRITRIVRAMKEFSHPAQEKIAIDLNHAIQSTVTVATNEWKYVAEVVTDLDDSLPQVQVVPSDINQAILNLVVNAAHAIAEVVGDGATKGTITVSTRRAGGSVEIRVGDTGCGIAPEIIDRIFDLFFTTKPVGKGTGQGLSQVYDTVVTKHGGHIDVESVPGQGTTFILHLPVC